MGFTMYLMLVYMVLFVLDIFAFLYGRQKKKWVWFILLTMIMIFGIVVLGYLCMTSPI